MTAATVVGTGLAAAATPSEQELGAVTSRVSVSTDEQQANGASRGPSVSADGRYVAFTSRSSNLVPGDTNDRLDAFVRVRSAGVTVRVSVGPRGRQSDGPVTDAPEGVAMSADGRFVAFASGASNLVAGDTNGAVDVFVRNLRAGVTRRVSVDDEVRQADGDSFQPALSADGRRVAFASSASNLVGTDTNDAVDVFVRNLDDRVTRRVSVGPNRRQGNGASSSPAISPGGGFVAFVSAASNLVAGDTNRASDVFVRDRDSVAGVTRRVSVGPGGRQANGASDGGLAVSACGLSVAFDSVASNLVSGDTNGASDVFVRDRAVGVTQRVSVGPGGRQADDDSHAPSISADGRYVAFRSSAANLTATADTNRGASDVFVRDRTGGVTQLVSVGLGGRQANGASFGAAISADGRHAAFVSSASNLVEGDTNRRRDVFVR